MRRQARVRLRLATKGGRTWALVRTGVRGEPEMDLKVVQVYPRPSTYEFELVERGFMGGTLDLAVGDPNRVEDSTYLVRVDSRVEVEDNREEDLAVHPWITIRMPIWANRTNPKLRHPRYLPRV